MRFVDPKIPPWCVGPRIGIAAVGQLLRISHGKTGLGRNPVRQRGATDYIPCLEHSCIAPFTEFWLCPFKSARAHLPSGWQPISHAASQRSAAAIQKHTHASEPRHVIPHRSFPGPARSWLAGCNRAGSHAKIRNCLSAKRSPRGPRDIQSCSARLARKPCLRHRLFYCRG